MEKQILNIAKRDPIEKALAEGKSFPIQEAKALRKGNKNYYIDLQPMADYIVKKYGLRVGKKDGMIYRCVGKKKIDMSQYLYSLVQREINRFELVSFNHIKLTKATNYIRDYILLLREEKVNENKTPEGDIGVVGEERCENDGGVEVKS